MPSYMLKVFSEFYDDIEEGDVEDCSHLGCGEDPRKSASHSHLNGIIILILCKRLRKTCLVRVLKGRRVRSSPI